MWPSLRSRSAHGGKLGRGLSLAAAASTLAARAAWVLPGLGASSSSPSRCRLASPGSSPFLQGRHRPAVRRFAAADGNAMSTWNVRTLRSFLDENAVPHADCFEKEAFLERARDLQRDLRAGRRQPGPAQAPTSQPRAQDPAEFAGFGELVTIEATDASSNGGEAAMIFLHGLGDSARGWASMLPGLLQLPSVRYVLPTAERLSFPGAPGGGGVNSWFGASVLGGMMGGGSVRDTMRGVGNEAMSKSLDYTHHLIRQELRRGTPADRIFLGGFSQGGCVALRSALSFPDGALGGCVAASTFIGDPLRLPIAACNAGLSVLCCHGEADQVVPTSEGARLAASLREKGVGTELRTYPGMGHTSSAEEAADVSRFVRRRLLAQGGVEALSKFSARELKVLLRDLGVDTSSCFDKGDLLEQAGRFVR